MTESEVLSSENESSRESWVKTVEPDMNSPVKVSVFLLILFRTFRNLTSEGSTRSRFILT